MKTQSLARLGLRFSAVQPKPKRIETFGGKFSFPNEKETCMASKRELIEPHKGDKHYV
jgi:hypothetical protein